MTQRPTKSIPSGLAFETRAVHAGNHIDAGSGAIRTPITLANSYALPEDPSDIDWSGTGTPIYTRNSGANQLALQEKLAALEGAEDAVALASGVAALHAVFFTFLRAGDHVVVADITYEATWRLFAELLPEKYGIEATFVDTSDLAAVEAAIRPETRLVHTETIANPTTRVADIAGIAALAHRVGALLSVDSTFTPPPVAHPLTDGADLVVHSLTKFINGHGDALGGAVLGSRELIERIRGEAMVDAGGIISPFNAWLISRGAITLPLRVARQLETAQRIAELLAADPRIAFVSYPGLAEHPQHELASRQFDGFGAVLSFALDGDSETQNRFVSELGVITSAVSLGHDETLIVHVGGDGPRTAAYPPEFREYGHLRLAIGLEDPGDLERDLLGALDAVLPLDGSADTATDTDAGTGIDQGTDPFAAEHAHWHAAVEAGRTSPHGPLSVTALHWLTSEPQSFPDVPGLWSAEADGFITFDPGTPPDGAADPGAADSVSGSRLEYDGAALSGRSTLGPLTGLDSLQLSWGERLIELAARGGGIALRPRDPESPDRVAYRGTETFPPRSEWVVRAAFEPAPRSAVEVESAAGPGREQHYDSPGTAVFSVAGEPVRLTLFGEADGSPLRVIYADRTGEDLTFPAARFLGVTRIDDDTVELDFNRTVNLPCAYSASATCPFPPPENRLPVRIEAGELRPGVSLESAVPAE